MVAARDLRSNKRAVVAPLKKVKSLSSIFKLKKTKASGGASTGAKLVSLICERKAKIRSGLVFQKTAISSLNAVTFGANKALRLFQTQRKYVNSRRLKLRSLRLRVPPKSLLSSASTRMNNHLLPQKKLSEKNKDELKKSLNTCAPQPQRKSPGKVKMVKREDVVAWHTAQKWSRWILVASPKKLNDQTWQKRKNKPGSRRQILPMMTTLPHSVSPALFEVAVQVSPSKPKKHVVFKTSLQTRLNVRGWEKALFGDRVAQLDNVLDNGCKVFVRFCEFLNDKDRRDVEEVSKTWDYAWNGLSSRHNLSRNVKKYGVVISSRHPGKFSL